MKDLKLVKEENEISILSNGSSLISQRKLAALLGVKGDAVRKYISRHHREANTSNGLDENTAFLVTTYYAYESKTSTQQARDFLKLIGAGGIRAYNYHLAGVPLNATPPPAAPKLTPLEIAHNALLTTSQALSDEIAERQKVEKMLEVAKVVELAGCSSDNDISVDEFCKIITSSLENTNLGRTKCYIIFRAIGLVETQSTRPTQRGMTVYLDYRKHEFGYSTRVIKAKGSNLIKLMIRTLRNKPNLNSALGYPLGDF